MTETQAGVTALITAYARVYHAAHSSQKIFDDFAADQLYTPEERRFFDQNLGGMLDHYAEIDPKFVASHPSPAAALEWVMEVMHQPITLSRSCYTEDSLEETMHQGIQQYIILGAGMDTFAFRRPELADQLHIFEVDHPATQALKHQRIVQAGWMAPAHLHFIPLDFKTQNLDTMLEEAAYDRQRLSFLSWLGVTYYLPREAIFATLKTSAEIAPGGSQIVFDYIDADGFDPKKVTARMRIMQDVAQQVGEPMQTGFNPLMLATDLDKLGWNLIENLSPANIQNRYFKGRTDRLRAFEHIWFARAIVA